MNPSEVSRMALLENDHWWYRGLRDLIQRTLQAPRFSLPHRPRVLDAGCGTGANLRLLQELLNPSYLGGFDISPQAIRLSSAKVQEADVYFSDICDPDVRVGNLDLVLSCDVITSAGIENCKNGLRQLINGLRCGGLFILNVPAFGWMFSEHDVAVGTQDRMSAPQVRRLLTELGLVVEWITYRVFLLFPAILLFRLPTLLRRPDSLAAVSDLRQGGAWTNDLLTAVLRAENRAAISCIRIPYGSSVFAVARKP